MDSKNQRNQHITAVFVHLGDVLPIELIRNAENLISLNPNAKVILLTDSTQKSFPGFIKTINQDELRNVIKPYLDRFPETKERDGGYWEKTITRFLALDYLEDLINDDTSVFHFESDVHVILPLHLINAYINEQYEKCMTLFPRLGKKGIGSVVYFPGRSALQSFIRNLVIEINNSSRQVSDMELLGTALDKNWALELQSVPSNNMLAKQSKYYGNLLFDGAAIGQYLLGVNPIHNEGILVSGYKNPYVEINWDLIQWRVSHFLGTQFPSIELEYFGEKFFMATLHVHSKQLISNVTTQSREWERVIFEANGGSRLERKVNLVSMKKSKLTLKTKLVIIRRMKLGGITKYFARCIIRGIRR
jgi:hypothetical protein